MRGEFSIIFTFRWQRERDRRKLHRYVFCYNYFQSYFSKALSKISKCVKKHIEMKFGLSFIISCHTVNSEENCVSLIFAFLALSVGHKIKISND